MHLLVIEDERALCETIVRSLRRQAYSVDCCYDGEKAVELLGVERYDLVLLDLNLPGKDGMTVLRTFTGTPRASILCCICSLVSPIPPKLLSPLARVFLRWLKDALMILNISFSSSTSTTGFSYRLSDITELPTFGCGMKQLGGTFTTISGCE